MCIRDSHIPLRELLKIPGIGEVKAVKLKSLAELSKRMAREQAASTLSFDSPDTVARYFMEELRHEEREKVLLLSLDSRLNLIEKDVLSIGTVNYSLLSAREIFVLAFQNKASVSYTHLDVYKRQVIGYRLYCTE